MSDPTHIVVRNARTHNLRGVDVSIPRNALVVFTGVSGSGKSSLVFDTIFKEGQRRFLESLSSYARQFLGQMERPEVDAVEGISPTLSIDQKTVNRNPRSTVGTITEIADHLRLLMARLGQPRCPVCGTVIDRLGTDHIVERLIGEADGRQVLVLGPVVQERKGEYRKELEALVRDGWTRVRVDGTLYRIADGLEEVPELERYVKHTIEVVVDRLLPSEGERGRLSEAVETALRLGEQSCTVLVGEEERHYSTKRACPQHPEQSVPEMEPRLFSFNAPQGACADCGGLGELQRFDEGLLFDPALPMPAAFQALNEDGKLVFSRLDGPGIVGMGKLLGGDVKQPFGRWSAEARQRLLHGAPEVDWKSARVVGAGVEERTEPWPGLVPLVERVWMYTRFPSLEAFRISAPCPGCAGARLSPIARSVVFREHNLPQLSSMSVASAHAFFQAVELGPGEVEVGELLLAEIRERLAFLHEVGLDYLTLSRSAATLSGGEAQRIRLASQVGSGLQGVTYILDEPSIGLHARDNARLLQAMRRLRDRGNSVLVVEHDPETILAADYVVDVGPGAGRLGGWITAEGAPGRFVRSDCPTAAWLRGERRMPEAPRRGPPERVITVRGARANNLRGLDVSFPVGRMTVVTGVSGSGKSSLVFGVLEPSLQRALSKGSPVACTAVEGAEVVEQIVHISQRPIGRTPRSNPATYTGLMDPIRDLFAATQEAQVRGWGKGRFSFNVPGGRCEACEGAGVRVVEMQFLPDVEVPCEACSSRRFNAETLEVRWRGRSIADVLDMTLGEALELFSSVPRVARILQTLVDVGLDYVSLGQTSTTLSGGEAQRVKLATELHRPSAGRTLYLLDEPTTGLHFEDVARLLTALNRLVEKGNTVIVVEHHLDVIRFADHVIDLGPEGGQGGGLILGVGRPEEIAAMDTATGQALAAGEALPVAAEAPARFVAVRPEAIVVEGARKHNLQAVSVRIPHHQLTVITGPSGCGKTSLAFDTIFAEGQRRYVESLSTYARRFLGRLDRAPVDLLEGLQPAIAIDQRSASHNPRSTVATVTEIHDVLRLLYARIGIPHCPVCQREIAAMSAGRAATRLSALPGQGLLVCAVPAGATRDGLVSDGWRRLWSDGRVHDLEEVAAIPAGAELVIDRFDPSKAERSRVIEAISRAYERAPVARFLGSEVVVLSRDATCPDHGAATGPLTPRHFSFNNRLGMCPTCEGLGLVHRPVPERLFTGQGPLRQALDPRVQALLNRQARGWPTIEGVLLSHGLPADVALAAIPPAVVRELMFGRSRPVDIVWAYNLGGQKRTRKEVVGWGGLVALVMEKGDAPWISEEGTCGTCGGGRLAPGLLAVTVGGLNIHELALQTVEDTLATVQGWAFDVEADVIAARPRLELQRRLSFLRDVGLGYVSLDRPADSLSGGESQRIRLASQLGSGLCGTTYVLDEPTIGLHPRDTGRLLDTLEDLRDQGNTVLVVEHDPECIDRADYVIDMGPAAGSEGGRVMAVGTPAEIRANPASITGGWLTGRLSVAQPTRRRKGKGQVTLDGARANNLKVPTVSVPLGVWTAVTGVSGSGKSTLIMDTLAPALAVSSGGAGRPGPYDRLQVEGRIDGVVLVDQDPIGRTPRSTPATYVGVMDKLRALFASTPGAMERGWGPGRFSFNAAGGRCETCEGRGQILVEMHFLPDVWILCDGCRGRRFRRETQEVRFKGASIADVLAMRADEALVLFEAQRGIKRPLQALVDVGLGYLRLGQPGSTLSGGEAQRVKLASELITRGGHRVYVLDEPTTGLHLSDVAKLVGVLQRLVDAGHTVITIEHHLEMIRQADHVIELGPDGGAGGGRIIAEGTPEGVAAGETSTGVALRGMGRSAERPGRFARPD